ncbi:glycosyl hydrolase family 32 [Confluentibacter flavum]|uniref:Glycosyl hydrolase family 32 n=1 Tax=Confluentibacter flavum TaxID=1909700 RepID=A0A2N3HKA2_9FLAO|nr:glycosyl hydrolase family 32 [Confluentibacter flavum]
MDRSRRPIEIPYLINKPAVIFIDVGRQLFVDDFLIEKTSLNKVYHLAEKINQNPIFKPETKIELNQGNIPVAAPFNDGLWYDSKQKLFKLWYHAGWFSGTGYATSNDGINWKRPELDVVKGTNLVLKIRDGYRRDGSTIWLDHETTDEQSRFKMFLFNRFPEGQDGELYNSRDGIHWDLLGNTSELGDNSGFFYNPFRKKWVFSIRSYWQDQRVRSYYESDEFYSASQWENKAKTEQKPVFWLKVDSLDVANPIIKDPTQFYDADVVAYESIMLGLFGIHRGPNNQIAEFGGFPKITDMSLGYSRDGFHFSRPDRRSFIGSTLKIGDWDRGYIHAVGGGCLVVGDKLYFYYSAWSGISPKLKNDMYAGGSMGLAILRRDGFVSLNADEEWGTLITRPVIFNGDYMFVNVDSKEGELQVEILNEDYEPFKPFLRESCKIISVDSTIQEVNWERVKDLGALKGKKVRFKFYLKKGSLYSFWVTPDKLGASYGFVAAGGPGLIGNKDTKGKRAYKVQVK